MVRDPRDRELPDMDVGQIVVADPYRHNQLLIEPIKAKEKYKSYVKREEKDIHNVFLDAQSDFLPLE